MFRSLSPQQTREIAPGEYAPVMARPKSQQTQSAQHHPSRRQWRKRRLRRYTSP